jgi:Flp pilus assembly protein TadG
MASDLGIDSLQTRRARLRARLMNWRSAESGVAAVEFALIAPILLVALLGMSDVTTRVVTDRKLVNLSRTLADLTSRSVALPREELRNIFQSVAAIMQPFPAGSTQMIVSSIIVTNNGGTATGAVDWSCGYNIPGSGVTQAGTDPNMSPRAPGSSRPVPAAFANSTSFILVEAKIPYRPGIFGGRDLSETTPWPVRDGARVVLSGGCPT